MEHFLIRLGFYMLRWQLSTPILAIIPSILEKSGFIDWLDKKINSKHRFIKRKTLAYWMGAGVANLIGSWIFFPVDKCIFKK